MLYIDFEVTWIRVTSCMNTIYRVKKLITFDGHNARFKFME